MSGLGNIQSVGRAMHVSGTPRNGKNKGKHVGTGSKAASSATPAPEETQSSASSKSVTPAEIADNLAERVISVLDDREKYIHAMDLSFGVEKPSYKKMWKVLKTVVKEIGDIKEANTGRFALGVARRLDEAPTLMEFGSLTDYLHDKTTNINEDTWKEYGSSLAHQITDNAAAAEQAQGNISAHRATAFLI